MKMYTKPIISIDTELAEGVYAASGSDNIVTFSAFTKVADWSNEKGQLKFTAFFSDKIDLSQLTLKVTFSDSIASAWGGGAICKC